MNGELDSESNDAKDIVNSLKKYKKTYEEASDKTAIITVRNPPREKSWFKSIARALSNWGSRISSEKVFEALDKTEEIGDSVANKWLSKFGKSYFSYSEDDAVQALTDKILIPAETRFRRDANRPNLTEEEKKSLNDVLFSAADQARLTEIRNLGNFERAKEKYKDLKNSVVHKEYYSSHTSLDRLISNHKENMGLRSEANQTQLTSKDPEIQLYLEYDALRRKKDGLRGLFMLKDKETGNRKPKIDQKNMDSIGPILKQLANAHNCSENEILIAYDESLQPVDRMDHYFDRKLEKPNMRNPN